MQITPKHGKDIIDFKHDVSSQIMTSAQDSRRLTIDELFKNSLEAKHSEQYKTFFNFIARFVHYSRYNTMLVYIQNPNVTFFGTESFWRKKFHRGIAPDAKPLIILAPQSPVMLAYDVMETTGSMTPKEFLDKGLKQPPFDIVGDFQEDNLERLLRHCQDLGIKVNLKPLSYFHAGAITTQLARKLEISLNESHTSVQKFSTLCHELAHLFLGHTGHEFVENKGAKTPRKIKLEQRKLSLKLQEMEAETVAFLVCKYVGLLAPSPTYLAGYIDNEKDWLDFSYETVIKVADRLQGLLISRLQRTDVAVNGRQAVDSHLVIEFRAYAIVNQYLGAGIISFISICTDIYQQYGIETLQTLFKYLKGAYSGAQALMEEIDYSKSDQNIRNITIEDIVVNASQSAGEQP